MTFQLNLKIEKGVMPRYGIMYKPLTIVLDNVNLRDIGWGEKASFVVPPGTHTLVLVAKAGGQSNPLMVAANDGDLINVIGFLDTKKGGLYLYNEGDKNTLEILRQDALAKVNIPEHVKEVNEKNKAANEWTISVCAAVGAGIVYFIHGTIGILPGGFAGAAIGAGVGVAVGLLINALFRPRL
jgi:hypothetical protein